MDRLNRGIGVADAIRTTKSCPVEGHPRRTARAGGCSDNLGGDCRDGRHQALRRVLPGRWKWRLQQHASTMRQQCRRHLLQPLRHLLSYDPNLHGSTSALLVNDHDSGDLIVWKRVASLATGSDNFGRPH